MVLTFELVDMAPNAFTPAWFAGCGFCIWVILGLITTRVITAVHRALIVAIGV